jgi:hypothetical protein
MDGQRQFLKVEEGMSPLEEDCGVKLNETDVDVG